MQSFLIIFLYISYLYVPFHPQSNLSLAMFYDFSKTNYNGMCDFLLDSDFRTLFESRDIEFVWSVFKYFIYVAVSLFTPKVFVSHSNDPNVLTLKFVITLSVFDL